MGVLNVTPDSFYIASQSNNKNEILQKLDQFIAHGVDIIDIGAVSTRPNAKVYTSESEEINRITNALEIIKKEYPQLIISCDTFRAKVAELVVQNYGVSIINDISGGTFDPLMFETVAKLKVPYILMHTKGTLQTMHKETTYEDLLSDILLFFSMMIQKLRMIGVNDIIVDPGFGFAKTVNQNFELLKRISYLRDFECPILVGLSRKSMFYKTFNTTPEESLNATNVSNFHALQSGANILRVHDVKEAKETIELYQKILME